ncbi:MAG: FAD-dependent oxidoreductase [Bacteroidetes bacterium]|nr:FAD-dependent oxidoreductase [Bacteroidota bacterium]
MIKFEHSTNTAPLILGAGITGLGCGSSTGFRIIERQNFPGGICASYHMEPGHRQRNRHRRSDEEDFRFEYGGGHWIFGRNEPMLELLRSYDEFVTRERKASVYLSSMDLTVPYPIQNNLRYLPADLREAILSEMKEQQPSATVPTMSAWCASVFGPTLAGLFFHPFHELYTAGLAGTIAPQDSYKTPVDLALVRQGAERSTRPAGYNTTFIYPHNGLNAVMDALERRCDIRYDTEAVRINPEARTVRLSDGSTLPYSALISTIPLNILQQISGLRTASVQDPYTSVLVLNIGARKGKRRIDDHWVYFPTSRSGFHRIGFYDNVDPRFLPRSKRDGEHTSLYVEMAYRGGDRPDEQAIAQRCSAVMQELQDLDIIRDAEIVDPTWIDVAYTWTIPGSTWREEMIAAARQHDIHCIGRYGAWKFQGILDSLNDGLRFVL